MSGWLPAEKASSQTEEHEEPGASVPSDPGTSEDQPLVSKVCSTSSRVHDDHRFC